MKNPNDLINPGGMFITIKEIGKLFSPPISRQKIGKLRDSGELPIVPIPVGGMKYYEKKAVIKLILELSEKDETYDLAAWVST